VVERRVHFDTEGEPSSTRNGTGRRNCWTFPDRLTHTDVSRQGEGPLERQDARRGASATVHSREADIAASYVRAIRSDIELARGTHEHLVQAHRDQGLELQGRLLCNVLRPRFISADRTAELRRVSRILALLLERAGEYLLSSDALLDLVHASEQEREIWAVDPGYPGLTVTSRLDSFMVGDQPKFVEYNAESPASIGYCDCLTEVFEASPGMRAWVHRGTLQRFNVRRALLDSLVWAYRERGGTGAPVVAIVDWDDVLTKRDFELCAEYFRESSIRTVVTDPRRLTYRGGQVLCGDERITLVYRRVLLHELLERADEAEPLLRAYREGAVCMVNSPRSKLLHKKAVFALLSDEMLGLDITDEERLVVDSTVPWTRLVVEGTTSYEGQSTDLIELLRANQDRFALKPVDDYGGRGVSLGWDTEPEKWQRDIEDALQKHYVVQERVEVPSEEFPTWKDDALEMIPMLVDTDPLLFRGEVGGILTRISGDPLLNVTAGTGSTTPTFVAMGEDR
jgi:hypothetical protein